MQDQTNKTQANPTSNSPGQSMPEASSNAKANQGGSAEDILYGKLDATAIRNNIKANTLVLANIKGIIESKKTLFIYTSAADPFNVCMKLLSQVDFTYEDLIILFAQVLVFGRSLKSLNKQKDNEVGKKFAEICNKYRIKQTYDIKKLEGQAKNFVTKVEHVFAAFPLVAMGVLQELVSAGLMNIITQFTPSGLDFQSSTALATWVSANDFISKVAFHEAKNQIYISSRTSAQDQSALYKEVTYRGQKMSVLEARNRQALDSRQYIILGMTSADILVKLLWAVQINVPPYKAYPPYRFIAEAARESLTGNNTLFTIKETETLDAFKLRIEESTARMQGDSAYDRESSKEEDKTIVWSKIGITQAALHEKLAVFTLIASTLKADPNVVSTLVGRYTKVAIEHFPKAGGDMDQQKVLTLLENHFTGRWDRFSYKDPNVSNAFPKKEESKK